MSHIKDSAHKFLLQCQYEHGFWTTKIRVCAALAAAQTFQGGIFHIHYVVDNILNFYVLCLFLSWGLLGIASIMSIQHRLLLSQEFELLQLYDKNPVTNIGNVYKQ